MAILLTLILVVLVSGCRSQVGEEARSVDPEDKVASPVIEDESPMAEVSTSTPTPTVRVKPNSTETADAQPTYSTLPATEPERAIGDANGWSHYQHDEHGYTISFPQDWTTQRVAAENLLITNSDLDIPRGSGNVLPPETIDVVIYPDVDPPPLTGLPVSVGPLGYEGYEFRGDPWGYLDWEHEIRIYYFNGSTYWLIDARFAEPVGGTNPLVTTFYNIIAAVEHQTAATLDRHFTPPPYYDREWAYRQRVIRDSERLWQSFSDYERLIMNHEQDGEYWEQQLEHALLVWNEIYDDFYGTVPPPSHERFHTHYIQALGWNSGSAYVLWTWNELGQRWFEWMVAQVMLRTADDLLKDAFQYWPAVVKYEDTFHEVNPPFAHYPAERSLKGRPLVGPLQQRVYETFGASGAMPVLHSLLTPISEADNVGPEDFALLALTYLAEYVRVIESGEDALVSP